MNPLEWRAVAGLSLVYMLRTIGLFMIMPVFAIYAHGLPGVQPWQIGMAIGIYGLTQAILQIPLGMASDRWGRKPIIVCGMLLFALGSFIAGYSNDINWIIIGRLVQGMGAVSSAVSALLADVTREAVRTTAMAILGAGIGVAVLLALILGPVVAGWVGVRGIFDVTGVAALLTIPVVLMLVPGAPRIPVRAGGLRASLADGQLLRLDGGIFVLHACMTALFVAAPFAIQKTLHMPDDEHWKVYLPVLLIAILPVFPLIRWAEKSGQTKNVFLAAIAALSVALALMGEFHAHTAGLIGGLTLFFVGTNFLEGSLPSMISRRSHPSYKGAALGVYSSSQFLGAFVGGSLGGVALGHWGVGGVFALIAVLPLLWLGFSFNLIPPVVARGQSVDISK
ncbi:MAG: MFS transporter [Stenotrophobium sp.]